MNMSTPLCCSVPAYQLLAKQLPALGNMSALLHGAVAISMHQLEEASVRAVDQQLQGYADQIKSRVKGRQPQAILAHLHEVLFEQERFIGNRDHYYNPLNSYLPAVLHTKQGLPITLSLLYQVVADRIGLKTWGVGLPGHFLVGVECGTDSMLVDCFNAGRILSVDEARELMTLQIGPEAEFSSDLLQPLSHRRYLTRLLQNLLNLFSENDHYTDVAAMLEMEMLLWPDQLHLQRDLALVLARCGLSKPARIWLDRYLATGPEDPQLSELMQLREVLR